MTETQNTWTETDSAIYRQLATVAVPAREAQIATLLTLMPFGPQDPFHAVELASGEGALSYALLDCFPNVSLLALDGSEKMRTHTAANLEQFALRAAVGAFDITASDWYDQLEGADVVVSSLCVHHLSGQGKRELFAAICRHLSSKGALLLADLVMPQRPEAQTLFADTWDQAAETQSKAKTDSSQLYELFIREQWNYYHYPDPVDQPSPLFEQLSWLKTAGFAVVDCFWLQAGYAIYGGYKTGTASTSPGVSYARALRSAKTALAAIS